jgi:enolase
MTRVSNIYAREVLDSRGVPTIEVEVRCQDGTRGQAIVPSGASTGKNEARELRDVAASRYDGCGVRQAVANVCEIIAPAIAGMDAADQPELDRRLIELDGTADKSRLGANAVLGVSLAAAHAAAASKGEALYCHLSQLWRAASVPTQSVGTRCDGVGTRLDGVGTRCDGVGTRSRSVGTRFTIPLPMTNMISGGLHAGGNLDFQDFLISPCGAPDYPTGLEWIVRVYSRLGRLLADAGHEARLVADEGGYGPKLASPREALEFLLRAIEAAGLQPKSDVSIALDVAATHFYDGRCYMTREGNLTGDGMIERLTSLVDDFPIASIEDPLAEEDWPSWRAITQRLGGRVRIVGDDLLTTNVQRVKRAIDERAANAVLIKVNQIGTLTETFETMRVARSAGWACIVSARSGETEDTTIADLAVATAADQIKIGSVVRSERLAKYNRLLRIADELS